MDDVGALTRRFYDFIDKLQFVIDAIKEEGLAMGEVRNAPRNNALCSAYAVSPAAGDMEPSLEALFSSIDNAIENIEKVFNSHGISPGEIPTKRLNDRASNALATTATSPGDVVFTLEELTFIGQTFDTILNTPHNERNLLYDMIELQDR